MPGDIDAHMGEVSDAMSENENEYDENGTIHKDDDDTMGDLKTEGADGTEEVKKKYDPKDPLRPRRKKARRACFACQRAHLTCGMCMIPPSCLGFEYPRILDHNRLLNLTTRR